MTKVCWKQETPHVFNHSQKKNTLFRFFFDNTNHIKNHLDQSIPSWNIAPAIWLFIEDLLKEFSLELWKKWPAATEQRPPLKFHENETNIRWTNAEKLF